MALTTANVTATLTDQANTPLAGATVTVILDKPDVDSADGFVLPLAQTFTADANGQLTMALWPNDRGTQDSRYRVTVRDAAGATIASGRMTVPSAGGGLFALLEFLPAGVPPYPERDDTREARLVADIAGLLHTPLPNADFEAKVKRWLALVLGDAIGRRRWWFLDHLSPGSLEAGADVVDLYGDLDRVSAVWCPLRLAHVALGTVQQARGLAARYGRPNAGFPGYYALEGPRRLHLWPAPHQGVAFAVLYTRPASLEIVPPEWEGLLVNGVLGRYGQHFDREALAEAPQAFERRYEEALRRASRAHNDLEQVPRWLTPAEGATTLASTDALAGTATQRVVPASLEGIGSYCVYPLVVQ